MIYIPQFYIFLATSEEKSSEENENDIEINLNINLNGLSEDGEVEVKPKMVSGELITSISFLIYCVFESLCEKRTLLELHYFL